jgi:hypothetical protein
MIEPGHRVFNYKQSLWRCPMLPTRSQFLEPLIQALRDGDTAKIREHLRFFQDPEAAIEIPFGDLARVFQEEDCDFGGRGQDALESMLTPDAPTRLIVLIGQLHQRARLRALGILMKREPRTVIATLIGKLFGPNPFYGEVLPASFEEAILLAKLGPAAGPATASLAKALDEDREFYGDKAEYNTIQQQYLTALKGIGPAAKDAIPSLIRIIERGVKVDYRDEKLPYLAIEALRKMGPAAKDAIPVLKEVMRNPNRYGNPVMGTGGLAATTLKRIAILSRIAKASPPMEGIEVMEDKALRIKEPLETFRRIGEICTERNDDRFSFREMERQISVPDTTIQDYMTLVSDFFREYFRKFEGVALAADDDKKASEDRKLFDRPGSGKKPGICRPWGWKAWELTCLFLKRRDDLEAAKRWKNPPKT